MRRQTRQVPRRHITLDNLLEQIVERLIRVRDQQRALLRLVVVQHCITATPLCTSYATSSRGLTIVRPG
jgi:hypothetical protein